MGGPPPGNSPLAPEPTPRRARLEPERIPIDAFAICRYPYLDLAEGWMWCEKPSCIHRAFATKLYPTEKAARAASTRYTEAWAETVFNGRRRLGNGRVRDRGWDGEFPIFQIRHLAGSIMGLDYRTSGCQIEDAYLQLANGYGTEAAWRVVIAHRRHFGIYGALLPGDTPKGSLFVFADARADLIDTEAGKVKGSM